MRSATPLLATSMEDMMFTTESVTQQSDDIAADSTTDISAIHNHFPPSSNLTTAASATLMATSMDVTPITLYPDNVSDSESPLSESMDVTPITLYLANVSESGSDVLNPDVSDSGSPLSESMDVTPITLYPDNVSESGSPLSESMDVTPISLYPDTVSDSGSPLSERWPVLLLLLPLLVAILANLTIIVAVRLHEKLHTLFHYVLVSLAVVNSVYCVIWAPFALARTALQAFPLPRYWCETWAGLEGLLSALVTLHLCLLSHLCHVMLTQALTYKLWQNKKRLFKLLAPVWMLSVLLSLPAVITQRLRHQHPDQQLHECGPLHSDVILSRVIPCYFLGIVVFVVFGYRLTRAMKQTRTMARYLKIAEITQQYPRSPRLAANCTLMTSHRRISPVMAKNGVHYIGNRNERTGRSVLTGHQDSAADTGNGICPANIYSTIRHTIENINTGSSGKGEVIQCGQTETPAPAKCTTFGDDSTLCDSAVDISASELDIPQADGQGRAESSCAVQNDAEHVSTVPDSSADGLHHAPEAFSSMCDEGNQCGQTGLKTSLPISVQSHEDDAVSECSKQNVDINGIINSAYEHEDTCGHRENETESETAGPAGGAHTAVSSETSESVSNCLNGLDSKADSGTSDTEWDNNSIIDLQSNSEAPNECVINETAEDTGSDDKCQIAPQRPSILKRKRKQFGIERSPSIKSVTFASTVKGGNEGAKDNELALSQKTETLHSKAAVFNLKTLNPEEYLRRIKSTQYTQTDRIVERMSSNCHFGTLVMALSVLYISLTLPYNVYSVYVATEQYNDTATIDDNTKTIIDVLLWLATASVFVLPLLCYIMSEDIRTGVQKIWEHFSRK